MAGGVALAAFPIDHVPENYRTFLAVMVISIGLLIAMGAAFRWLRVERAMREKKPLPTPMIIPVLSFTAAAASLLAIWVFVA